MEGLFEDFKVLDISFMRELWKGTNQLTDPHIIIQPQYDPSVIVPLRNMIFATIAVAYANSIGAERVLLGCNTGDTTLWDGDFMYPDCDSRAHLALETALKMGIRKDEKDTG